MIIMETALIRISNNIKPNTIKGIKENRKKPLATEIAIMPINTTNKEKVGIIIKEKVGTVVKETDTEKETIKKTTNPIQKKERDMRFFFFCPILKKT